MCSRFENKENGLSIFKRLNKNSEGKFILDELEDTKRDKISPTDRIIIIFKDADKFKITNAQWGIKFHEDKTSPTIFNSRIETIKQKSYWKNIFKNNRCLIPATAFYEWVQINNKKLPQKIYLYNIDLFFFSSIYTTINNKVMVSLITTEPNSFMKNIHRRMPHIILEENILQFFSLNSESLLNEITPLNDDIQMKVEELT